MLKQFDVLFRLDAGITVGLGHLRRCLALAEALTSQGISRIGFLTRYPSFLKIFLGRKFIILGLQARNLQSEISEYAQIFKRHHPRLLIIDHYEYTPEAIEAVHPLVGKLVYIDDTATWERYPVDGIINHNVYATQIPYPRHPALKLFLGSRYCLVPKEILVKRRWRNQKDSQLNLLISLGGGANRRMLQPFLQSFRFVQTQTPNARAYLMKGFALNSNPVTCPGLTIVPAHRMADAMAQCNLAISASGVTSYELACLGIPAFLVVTADNQRRIAAEMDRRGAAIQIGQLRSLRPEKLAERVLNLWEDSKKRGKMARRGKKLIDGKGPLRLASEIRKTLLR